jgi:hypothetical protein
VSLKVKHGLILSIALRSLTSGRPNMHRIFTMATTTADTMVITDYLALAVVLASMLAMSLDNVTGALLLAALAGYMAPAITSEARSAEPRLG